MNTELQSQMLSNGVCGKGASMPSKELLTEVNKSCNSSISLNIFMWNVVDENSHILENIDVRLSNENG